MSRSTDQRRTFISSSARAPASVRSPATRGAANGKSSVGFIAGLMTAVVPPTFSVCSLPTHSTRSSTSVYDAMLVGATHSAAS
ncbi:Uncharacterised protein [Mycobacteroides abscessus subsp. abscessus]|nr:Uncharacterised protein [Mycobacteroides abscessus subsp. abscessus]